MLPRSLPLVVLVEDSDDDTFFFRRALGKTEFPCEFLRLHDGGSAVRYFEEFLAAAPVPNSAPEPIVFLDLKLPILSGFEIARWLVDRNALQRFRISVLTGSHASTDVARARQLGIIHYLVKPVAADVLSDRLLGASSGASQAVFADPLSE